MRRWALGVLRTRPAAVSLLAAMLVPSVHPVRAVPPDQIVRLAVEDGTFLRVPLGDWHATSTDENVVRVQVFDTAEAFLEARGPGSAQVLVTNPVLRQIKVWRVRVGESEPDRVLPDPAVLADPCGCGQQGGYPVRCKVRTAACVRALRALLTRGDLTVEDVGIVYTTEGLQALLQDLKDRLDRAGYPGIELAFEGANLRLRGRVASEQRWRGLMLELYRGMVGKLLVSHQLEIAAPETD